MNHFERNILHGLYLSEKRADHPVEYKFSEIRWLEERNFNEIKEWLHFDELRRRIIESWNPFDAIEEARSCGKEDPDTLSRRVVSPSLQHLQHLGFIRIVSSDNERAYITLTAAGISPARDCQTKWGRLKVWFDFHKDRLPGRLLTAIIGFAAGVVLTLLGIYVKGPT